MTVFKFKSDKDGHITGFSMSGHSGYAEEGSDILCSAMSSCVQMIELGLIDVLGKRRGALMVSKQKTMVICRMPKDITNEEKEKFFLFTDTFYKYISKLEKAYKKHIFVVKRRVYPC